MVFGLETEVQVFSNGLKCSKCRKYSNAVGYRVGLTLGAVGKSDGKKTTEPCNVVGSHPRDHPIQGDRSALISRLTGVY